MVENGGGVRRSRRAASLTAQVLWNFQIEDDNNSRVMKSDRKPSIAKEEYEKLSHLPSKRGRKRSIVNTENSSLKSNDFYGKKKKLVAGCSGRVFPITKPLQIEKDAAPKKLTASVAPLVKVQPTYPKQVPTLSTASLPTSSHVNPILLLPVSLQANQGLGAHRAEMGGLSLVTLQAPDLLNCFGLNKSSTGSTAAQKHWSSSSCNMPVAPAIVDRLNAKIKSSLLAQNANDSILTEHTIEQPQSEPLNLKMGESTIPSFKHNTKKPKVAFVQPINSLNTSVQSCEAAASMATESQRACAEEFKKENISIPQPCNRIKPQRRKSRTSPVNLGVAKQSTAVTICKKRHTNCPSPDYVCSSPDVDDVHREPRHSCTRKQINLRHKAAPAPDSRDYEAFIELQRRLLAEAKRAQRAKAKAKTKLQAKKRQIKREATIEDMPITTAEPLKPKSPEERNNGWRWTGKPYTSRVFSVDHSKYVPRQCYPGMCRVDKRVGTTDYVFVRDCVFLLAVGEEELSYIARVTALWEKPNTKEMMVSLVWYYRPEHTDDVSKNADVGGDELFASRHQDEFSVACVEERCNVQTYSQFCRIQAKSRRDRLWMKDDLRRIVPDGNAPTNCRPMLPDETEMCSNDLFFSRYFYDVFQHRIKTKLPLPSSLTH